MSNKVHVLLLILAVTIPIGCSRMALHEDYGKAVNKNKILQAENISAAQESHPEVKMDGQKAVDVVGNYRRERPEVDEVDLTR